MKAMNWILMLVVVASVGAFAESIPADHGDAPLPQIVNPGKPKVEQESGDLTKKFLDMVDKCTVVRPQSSSQPKAEDLASLLKR